MKFASALISMLVVSAAGTAVLTPEPTLEETAAAWPVVRGSIGGDPVRWYVAFERRKGVQLCELEPSDWPSCRELDGLSLAEVRTQPLQSWAEGSIFFLTERLESTVPARALKHSRSLGQLVAGSRASQLGTEHEPTVEAEVRKAIDANLHPAHAEAEPKIDEREFDAWTTAWALEHRGDDALFEAFTRHLSVGTCSYDDTPNRTARLFAELALARGDLPTFIDLHLRLMSSSFQRVAWSTWGEEAQPTYAQRLTVANVELDELFLGLLIRHPGASGSVNAWRLSRAIREAGHTQTVLPLVQALATDESLDAYNRFRATEVWLHLQVYDEATEKHRAAVKTAAARLRLHPLSRMRVDAGF